MTLFTLSKIKRVCTIILIPRIFRGDGCTPGKFHRLKYEAIRKVHKSSSSGRSDDFRCKRCKRIIDRAFGPPQYYYYVEKPRLREINNENNKLHNKKAITRIEDLRSKVTADAKANVLLRARELNMILASINKQDKNSHAGTVRDLAESIKANKIEYEGVKSSGLKTEELEASKLGHEAVENKDELKAHAKSEKSDVVLSSTAGKDNNEVETITEKTGLSSSLKRFFGKNKNEFEEKGEKPSVLLSETVGKDKEKMEAKDEKAYIVLSATDGKDKDEFKPHSLETETKENMTDDVSSTTVKDGLKLYDTTAKKTEENKSTQILEQMDENLPEYKESRDKAGIILSATAEKDKENVVYNATPEKNEIEAKCEKANVVNATTGNYKEEFETKDEQSKHVFSATAEKDKENVIYNATAEKNEIEAKCEKADIVNTTAGNYKEEFGTRDEQSKHVFSATAEKDKENVIYNATAEKNEIEAKCEKADIVNTTAGNYKEEFDTRDEQSKHVFSATAKKENEFEALTLNSETKENLTNDISSEKEKVGLKLNATTGKKDEQQKLIQKLEEINEVPLVEPEPERDIGNNSKQELGPNVMNATPIDKRHMTRAQFFDEIAKKYLRSSMAQIDRHLGKEMEKFNVRFDMKSKAEDDAYLQCDTKSTGEGDSNLQFNTQSEVEGNAKEKAIVNTFKSTQLEASPKMASNNLALQDQETISEPKVVSMSSAEPQEHLQSVSSSNDNPQEHLQSVSSTNDNPQDHLQFVSTSEEKPIESKDAERGDVRCTVTTGELTLDPVKDGVQNLENQKQPDNFCQGQLIDGVHPAAPKASTVLRHDTVEKLEPVDLEAFKLKDKDDAVERTMKRSEEEFPLAGNRPTHYYTECKKHWYMGIQDLQAPASPILPNSQAHAINIRCLQPEIAEETKAPPRSAKEIAQSFIQAQPLPVPEEQQTLAETEPFHPVQICIDATLPEINLNDETVTLTELLHRVRERNRIMYCREIGLQMAKNMAALNPQGKCGTKKPACPPPAPTCPPPDPCPPPPCPPPPPPCPKPCKKKCPTPGGPPKCKCSAQDAVSMALHLGPIVNPAKELSLPLLVCNLSSAESSDENSSRLETWADMIKQKLNAVRESVQSVFERFKGDIAMSVNGTRDFKPWTPIPSWPYPVVQKKRRLQCPKEGCPTPPPSRPRCPEGPCTGFPKRLAFASI